MITILSDRIEIKNQIEDIFHSRNLDYAFFDVNQYEIQECISCGGCTYKTYGKCILKDDTVFIYPSIISSEILYIITNITYGNYSFKMKRVLDKLGLSGSRFYFVADKSLKKGGMWPGAKDLHHYHFIGIQSNLTAKEKDVFTYVVNEFFELTNGKGSVNTISDINKIKDVMEETL